MISIIIPTLNEEKYIGRLLNSIEAQTLDAYELIVIDAGSVDKTRDIIKKRNIKFKNIKEKNVSKQRNLGAKMTQGEIFVFLDADTELKDTHFLDKIIICFNNPKIKAITTNVKIINANWFDNIFHTLLNLLIRILNILNIKASRGACQAVRKEFFPGYNEKMTIAEDVDMFRRIKGKIKHANITVYESARRYRKMGYLRVVLGWIFNRKKWEAVR